ncbi:MAG TPA: efflux RND transporter permease subunit [Candidatus Eisenbacteria bacterium]|nr:efflux RND transporter permease subunit [Candidatus Eisenbacteria bacterium]
MLRSIIQSCLKSRYVVVVLAAAFLVVGVGRLRDMPIDVLPEFALPYVEIQTEALGLSAEEVEQLITLGMEQDLLNGVPWVESIRSESLPGLSSIVIVFKRGTDLMRARQMVSERLTQAYALPHVSKPPIMIQPRSATSRVMIVGLSSKTMSPIQMSVLARWTIVPRLKGVPGVANVAIWGQRDRQLQVRVDPRRLQDHKVSLLQVLETTGNSLWWSTLSFVEASTPGAGGFIDTHNQRLGIRHVFPITSAEGLAEVPIEDSNLHLGDIATVVEDHQPLIGDALTKDGEGLLLVVEKFPDTNTLDVTEDVEQALNELLPGLPGMDVNTGVYRPADFIQMAMRNLGSAMVIGIVLLLLLMIGFFFSWRTTLVGLVAIPLSVLAAGVVLQLTGATINAIVLTGIAIAIGIVVYDTIADVDHVVERLRRMAGGNVPAPRVILDAALESRSVVTYGTLILLLAVAPIYWMGGASGPFFEALALSYGLAILTSMAVAWLVTPALCYILLANAPAGRTSPVVAGLNRLYEPLLTRLLPQGRLAFAFAILLAVGTVALLPTLSPGLLPRFKERNLVIRLSTASGTSQPEMTRLSGRVRSELKSIAGVADVSAHIGRAVLGDEAVDVHSAELWVTMDPKADYDRTAAAIQTVVDGYPGVKHRVETYLGQVSEDVTAGPDDRIVTRVYGETEAGLHHRAEQVQKAIEGIGGIKKTHIDSPVQEAAIETDVDMAAARRYGLKPGDVRRAAAALMSGIVVGNLYEEQKVFEVVVWSTPETRHSLSSIRDLLIDSPSGVKVRLGDVAKVRVVSASSEIRHDAVKRYLDVAADVEGRDLRAVAGDIAGRVAQLQFPLEYHAEVVGDYAHAQAMRSRMMPIAIAALIAIFFLLHAAFSSWRLAALAFFSLPAALAGGVLAASVTGGALTIGSLAGLLGVFGIAVYNRLMLFSRYQQMERQEGEGFGPGLALRGARERLSPMLMAALAAAATVIPALILGDQPGLEIVRPMALVLLGGLVTSTGLDLLFMPAMFLSLGASSAHEHDPLLETQPGHGFGSAVAPSGGAGD